MDSSPPAPDPFQLAFDLSPTGTVLTDAEGRIVMVNREFVRLFGYANDDLIGRPIELLIPERHRSIHPRHRARYAQAPPHQRPMGTGRDLSGRRRDGTEFPVEIGLMPVERDGHRYVIASVVDITERRRLEETLLHAQRLDAIGTLAGGIAHDFNNLLGVIAGYASVVRESLADRPAARQDLDQVLRAAERGRWLVRGILAFGHRTEMRRQSVRLDDAIEETRPMLRAILPATVEIRTQVAPGTPTVFADPTQLQQVLVNLATNGARAMEPQGGVLELEAAPLYVDSTLTSAHPELRQGPHAHITVRDQGVGMSPEVQERVFQPFFTTRPRGEGTGLGLTVVQGIVRDHGGAIGIESAPGTGTVVHVYLPETAASPVGETEAEGEAPRGLGERILFVDDEPDLSQLWKRLLEGLGYVVECAPSGTAALEVLRERRQEFDVLLTDFSMPGITGAVLAEEARRLRPDLPVILMSGYGDGVPSEARERGWVREVLGKPFSSAALGRALRAALDVR